MERKVVAQFARLFTYGDSWACPASASLVGGKGAICAASIYADAGRELLSAWLRRAPPGRDIATRLGSVNGYNRVLNRAW